MHYVLFDLTTIFLAERFLEPGSFPLRIQLEWDVNAEGRFVLKLDNQIPTSSDVFGDVATFKKADSNGEDVIYISKHVQT